MKRKKYENKFGPLYLEKGTWDDAKLAMLGRCIDLAHFCTFNNCTFNELILSIYIQGLQDGFQCGKTKQTEDLENNHGAGI
jgi:hypothetical protein